MGCAADSVFSSLLLLVFFIFLHSRTVISRRQCFEEDASALLQLNQGFVNPASWLPEADCCSWDGVSCDPISGRVVGLDLSCRYLHGEVDDALFNLTSLTALNLAQNRFHYIPLSSLAFERLPNLTSLNLSQAGFMGQIPASIGQLTNLVSLDISTFDFLEDKSSSFKLLDPNLGMLIKNLSGLKELVLDGVNISANRDDWGKAVSTFTPELRVLSLAACSLSGPIDPALTSLKWLLVLRLDQNSFGSNLPDFFSKFLSLISLHLQACELHGKFPAKIFQLPKLTYLDISGNSELSGQLPEFAEGSPLQALILSSTNFSGTMPESIGKLMSLKELQLYGCNFYGTLPNSLGNLTELVHFDLSFNNFSGEIPKNLHWPNISEIFLSQNKLTGPIPSFITEEFQNLMNFDLEMNSISGSIPPQLFALPSLRSLLLSQNKLSGELEELWNVSSSLEIIDLSNNEFEGPIPKSLFQLPNLKVLSLASNNFCGSLQLDIFLGMKNLFQLDLSYNRLSVGFSNSVSLFPKLSTLKLVSCNLTKIPNFLHNNDQIVTLDLSNNKIDGVIPRWIWSIGNGTLTYLNLSCNMFTSVEEPLANLSVYSPIILDLHSNKLQGSIPFLPISTIFLDYSGNEFSGPIYHNLTLYLNYSIFLSLSNNYLFGEIPPSICNATYLQVFDLSYNYLNGSIPSCLMESDLDLGVLNLEGNHLSGTLPQNINKYCGIQTLKLKDNNLIGKLPQSILNCNYLEILDLGNNLFADSFPYWLGNLSQLHVLVLRSNRFHGSLLESPPESKESTKGFRNLQIFDVSNNNFSGNLPAGYFKNLKGMMFNSNDYHQLLSFPYLQLSTSSYYQNTISVTLKGQDVTLSKILSTFASIDISNNKFSGNIPEVIGGLKSLLSLNMSHNNLIGRIPSCFGNLSQLESLDLSYNQISGEIPQELTSLTFLTLLNLSYNHLVGSIPQYGQFGTFSNLSFAGNDRLCGSPLSVYCNHPTSKVKDKANQVQSKNYRI